MPVTIKPSPLKMFGLLLASITLTGVSLWILMLDPQKITHAPRSIDPWLLQAIAALGSLLFGAATLAVPIALWRGRHGLRLDDQGIHSHTWDGLLGWHEISRISASQHAGQKLLLIHVHQPERLLARAGRLRGLSMRMNLKNVGTPLVLSSNALQIGFEALHTLVADGHAGYQARSGAAAQRQAVPLCSPRGL